jgi:hypothetical protein
MMRDGYGRSLSSGYSIPAEVEEVSALGALMFVLSTGPGRERGVVARYAGAEGGSRLPGLGGIRKPKFRNESPRLPTKRPGPRGPS